MLFTKVGINFGGIRRFWWAALRNLSTYCVKKQQSGIQTEVISHSPLAMERKPFLHLLLFCSL